MLKPTDCCTRNNDVKRAPSALGEASRQERAVDRVRDCLTKAGCRSVIKHTDDTIFTVDDASRVVGASPEKILKSLLFLVEDGQDGREWLLVMMSGANKVNDKKVRRLLGARKVRMGTAGDILAYCGFEPGGIPPVGYDVPPRALLDEDLFLYDVVWAAAGSDHDFFPIAPEELLRITGGERADIKKSSACV